MVAKLIMTSSSGEKTEYELVNETTTIGRKPGNDIQIDNLSVSGRHAQVITILEDSFLEDLGSTNGTYVNGKLIKKHALQHGDVITIGHHQLRFSDQEASDAEQDEFEATMVIPSGQQNAEQIAEAERAADKAAASEESAASPGDLRAASIKLSPDEMAGLSPSEPEPAPEPPPPPPPPPPQPERQPEATIASDKQHSGTQTGINPELAPSALPLAKLQVLSGAFAGRELELTKALTTLGRPGVQVAAVTRRKEGYFIVHVESGKEGDYPLVNGDPIGPQARRLQDNDIVQLAGVKMGFFAA